MLYLSSLDYAQNIQLTKTNGKKTRLQQTRSRDTQKEQNKMKQLRTKATLKNTPTMTTNTNRTENQIPAAPGFMRNVIV